MPLPTSLSLSLFFAQCTKLQKLGLPFCLFVPFFSFGPFGLGNLEFRSSSSSKRRRRRRRMRRSLTRRSTDDIRTRCADSPCCFAWQLIFWGGGGGKGRSAPKKQRFFSCVLHTNFQTKKISERFGCVVTLTFLFLLVGKFLLLPSYSSSSSSSSSFCFSCRLQPLTRITHRFAEHTWAQGAQGAQGGVRG